MKKFTIISSLSLLALLAGCGSCSNNRSCTPDSCQEQTCVEKSCGCNEPCDCHESSCCKEDVCEVAHVAPQHQRISGTHSDTNVAWDKEDFA